MNQKKSKENIEISRNQRKYEGNPEKPQRNQRKSKGNERKPTEIKRNQREEIKRNHKIN